MAEWWEEEGAIEEAAPAAPAEAGADATPTETDPMDWWMEEGAIEEPEPEPEEDTGPRNLVDVVTDAMAQEDVVKADADTANADEVQDHKNAMQGMKQVAPGIWIPESRAWGEYLTGGAEVLGTIVSGAVAEPVSGLAGLVGAALPGEAGQGAEVVEGTQEAMTYMPRTEVGQELLADIGSFLTPVGEGMAWLEEGLGGLAGGGDSPMMATTAHMLPTALLEAVGQHCQQKNRRKIGCKSDNGAGVNHQSALSAFSLVGTSSYNSS